MSNSRRNESYSERQPTPVRYFLPLSQIRILHLINILLQTCVAPDYVLVSKDKRDALVEALSEVLQGFYPTGDLKSDSLSHIVSRSHFDRLRGILGKSKGKIARGGKSDPQTLKFEITIVTDVDGNDELMKE